MADVKRELTCTVGVFSKDATGLGALAGALTDRPRGWGIAGIEVIAEDRDGRPTDKRGELVCTLVVTLRPLLDLLTVRVTADTPKTSEAMRAAGTWGPIRDQLEQGIEEARDRMARQVEIEEGGTDQIEAVDDDDPFPGPTGDGTDDIRRIEAWYRRHPTERKISAPDDTGAADPYGYTQWEDRSGNLYASRAAYENGAEPIGARSPGGTFVSNIGPSPKQVAEKEAAHRAEQEKLAASRAEASRAFQIEAIESTLRRQDESARTSGGVRPFSNRMEFAAILRGASESIRLLTPMPGGTEVGVYRDWLKGIAANCVRELQRTAQHGRAAL